MNFRLVIILAVCCMKPFMIYSQDHNSDSIFYAFQKCIGFELSKKYNLSDTSVIVFYGQKYNYNLKISKDYVGGKMVLSFSESISNTTGTDIFYGRILYVDFMNLMKSDLADKSCPISINKGLTFIYVDCPQTSWEQCLADAYIYDSPSKLYLTLDQISYFNNSLVHQRFVYILVYNRHTNIFNAESKTEVEKRIVCHIN